MPHGTSAAVRTPDALLRGKDQIVLAASRTPGKAFHGYFRKFLFLECLTQTVQKLFLAFEEQLLGLFELFEFLSYGNNSLVSGGWDGLLAVN